jgi:5'-methylthioadenosine phosphorylase
MTTERIGIIGGSGLGNALLATGGGGSAAPSMADVDTPFGKPSAPIILSEWNAIPIAILPRHGVAHTLPPTAIPFRANIYALKSVGCRWILASGAVGSLRENIAPRDLVIADQVIDKTNQRVGTFFDEPGAAVHVEFAEPFCPKLREILRSAAKALPLGSSQIHDSGTYVCMEGPAFSSRAESLMHRAWGGDLIGMTAMPEAKLAREAEIAYALIALVTDYDCWRNNPVTKDPATAAPGETAAAVVDPHELLKEIIGNLQTASQNAINLMKRAVELMAQRREQLEASPARRALELAIWSDKSRIDPAEVQRLGPLWMKYF